MSPDDRSLPTYRPPSGLRAHAELEHFQRMAGSAGREVLWSDTLRPWLGKNRFKDARGIYIWDPGHRHADRRLANAIDWSFDHLELSALDEPASTRDAIYRFLRPWYAGAGGGLAFVIVESCRDLFLKRFQETSVRIQQGPVARNRPRFNKESMDCMMHRKMTLASGAEYFPAALPLVAPDDRPLRETQFTFTRFRRTLLRPSGKTLQRNFDCWCLSTRDEHYRLVQRGGYPSQVLKLVGDRINPGQLMCWVLLHPKFGLTEHYCFDFDPFRGAVLTIRHAFLELEMLTEMDPRLDRWLYKALHGRDYVLDE